ncbi:uncharacterized protein KY384_004200 [Bacidia gigantensis]|uniref:uncharacterized protein n=1 Tax=Bacidia gigantensis TaxID=2732470 RepID=UPI001D04CCBA|nr:uncharacterized protein KY384_004200 [Bacidia gigantensis]KAG8530843.1 hypothetical protein KY384_004200 [Bacidia gigantensis]
MPFLSVCTALYDYEPQSEGELSLKEGELVYILEKGEEDDWWKGKKRASNEDEEEPEGLIPNNYVEDAQPTHHAKALYEYSRQTDEELSFDEDATLVVFDNMTDPEWTLVGHDGEYGFVPANYIEITGKTDRKPQAILQSQPDPSQEQPSPVHESHSSSPKGSSSGPAAAIAGIMHKKAPSIESSATPSLPPRQLQLTPEVSDEEPMPPSLPRRPPSEQLSPPPTQVASPKAPASPGIAESPPYSRAIHPTRDDDRVQTSIGGFHLYNISEMVSAMGKQKKLPTTLGVNIATGKIMIAPEKSRDGPTMEWTAEKLTHYSIEGKHVFLELVRPSKSIDFHAGAKDTAQEIVAGLGEIAGAARAEGLREVLEAAGSIQKKGAILYDFMAQGDDEVTVAIGDEVLIIDDTKSEEWWMVRRIKNSKQGVVPSSYVEVTATGTPTPTTSGLNAGKSVVEQNRMEEERLTKEAMKSSAKGSEVGPGVKLPDRGSSLSSTVNQASQRSKKEGKHGRTSSSSKSKPDASKLRTWTDRSDHFKVEAQFLGLRDSKIHLHKLNGVKIAVPVAKMALADLEYVESVTGQSLDDDKPLSNIKRRSNQTSNAGAGVAKPGASVERPRPTPKENEYDWFDFFLRASVEYNACERYAYNFRKDSMDEGILPEINSEALRRLGLKEGDCLRVMKYLDAQYGRNGQSEVLFDMNLILMRSADRGASPDPSGGGLFSGPGGALRNNTRKGRPAPAVEVKDVVDESVFKPKTNGNTARGGSDSVPTPLTQAPPPPEKDRRGFDNDAWDVKPSRQPAPAQANSQPVSKPERAASVSAQQSALSGSLLDLSSLSPPLQPTIAPQPPSQQTSQQAQLQKPLPREPEQQPQSLQDQQQTQPTGANAQFFSQLGPAPGDNQFQSKDTAQPSQAFSQQQLQQIQGLQQPQQTGPARQRPQAPQIGQQNSLIPPPPLRPLSAPQTQPQSNSFGPPPLQPQLTGFQLQTQPAPLGQSLNELGQQRFQQQQQFGQQAQQYGQQTIQPQQTGFIPQQQNYGIQNGSLIPQVTGFGQNPYVNGQQAGSPFADPRLLQQPTGFQALQQQSTSYQPQFQSTLQPQPTGINSMLPAALQPQPTGVNGFSRSAFGQSPPPVPPIPAMVPQQTQPHLAPLQPQKTGPAPPVRFGTQPANKLVPQATGRKANLNNAISPGAGFPDHAHRGQETITYILRGAVDHEDFAGNKGTIEAGDLQFMTAGKGIVHAEMPRQNKDGSPNVGMQLWVDLPQKLKACEPRYRDLRAREIPTINVDDGKVTAKIISGSSHGTESVQELAYTPVWLFDISIKPGGKLEQELPVGWNAFAYTLSGSTTFGVGKDSTTVGQYHNVVFEQKGDSVHAAVSEDAQESGNFILVAGLPLDQKVVQYGPFVLNSQEQVIQAMMDFQNHENGFERAKDWRSEIGKGMVH